MDTRLLRYFVSVAEHLNFSAAAKQLHITQPSLGRQIAQLEQEIGVQLFNRNTRSVQLTAAGAALLHEAHEILHKTEVALTKTRQISIGAIGSLQIGFMSPLEKHDLPIIIKKFRNKHPNSNINFSKLGLGPLNEALEASKLDIAFTMAQDLDRLSHVSWRLSRFCRPPGLLVPKEHPLASKTSVQLAGLQNECFVMFPRSEFPMSYDHLCHMCALAGFSPNIVAHSPFLETLLLMVETGIGITIHPQLDDSYASNNLRFIPIVDFTGNYDSAVAWKTTNSNPLLTLFLETLQEENILI